MGDEIDINIEEQRGGDFLPPSISSDARRIFQTVFQTIDHLLRDPVGAQPSHVFVVVGNAVRVASQRFRRR